MTARRAPERVRTRPERTAHLLSAGVAKRFHMAAGALTAVHQAVALAAGTGVIGQSSSGLGPAIGASVALDGGWMVLAKLGGPPSMLSFLSGVAMGVPLVHFTLWPWTARPVPALTEAEGLPESLMAPYNGVLYAWFLSGLLGLLIDTPRGKRRWAWLGLAAIAAIRPAAKAHFAWMAKEAGRNPQWWNRAWQGQPEVAMPEAGPAPSV